MKIERFEAGPLGANNYLLIDNKEAVLIDCSEAKPEILKALDGINLKYILLTHGHFDHVLGVNEMREKTGAKVYIHQNDLPRMQETSAIMQTFGVSGVEVPQANEYLKDGDVFGFGDFEIKVIQTPGHTQGCVCYLVEDKLFSGDTLFKDSVGRCDLPGGDFAKMSDSIKNILFKLDENITVYPGHGPETTIGYEKKYNELI